MTISAKVVAHSVADNCPELITVLVRYPRIIHSEIMTHRVFSRNASSSRAIPIKKIIQDIIDDPAEPVEWGANQKGMQAGKPLTGWRLWLTRRAWHGAKWAAIYMARLMILAGVHKQVANRILEPWSHINVLISATDWKNFFHLRLDEDADPTVRAVARAIWDAKFQSVPRKLEPGEIHAPFITDDEWEILPQEEITKISTSRNARLSYYQHGSLSVSYEADLALYDRLIDRETIHASPTEHVAWPAPFTTSGNFRGWKQFRKIIPGEAIHG